MIFNREITAVHRVNIDMIINRGRHQSAQASWKNPNKFRWKYSATVFRNHNHYFKIVVSMLR